MINDVVCHCIPACCHSCDNQNGCLENMDELLKARSGADTKELERQLCGHIYSEMLQESEGGQVPTLQQDLFLEQSESNEVR